ncbi:MAG: hypothetical protein AAF268_01355 [Cyanobacteria bacterium P01_A01_bin.3]
MRSLPLLKSDIQSYSFASRYAMFGARLRMYVNNDCIDPDRPIAQQLHQWHYRLVRRHHLMDSLLCTLSNSDS